MELEDGGGGEHLCHGPPFVDGVWFGINVFWGVSVSECFVVYCLAVLDDDDAESNDSKDDGKAA